MHLVCIIVCGAFLLGLLVRVCVCEFSYYCGTYILGGWGVMGYIEEVTLISGAWEGINKGVHVFVIDTVFFLLGNDSIVISYVKRQSVYFLV